MSDFKNLQPKSLATDKSGRLFVPFYINSYEDLGILLANLNTSIDVLAEHEKLIGRPDGEIGLAIGSITTVLEKLSGVLYEDMHLLDKLKELNK